MGIKQLYDDNLRKLLNEYGDVSVMKENLTVFVNINKKPKYPFQLFLALLAEIHQKFTKYDGVTSILLIVT